MSYVDIPNKKQKHPHYEHRAAKLNRKNNEFTSKKFHHVRNVSTHKKLLKSFGRIGMCLNDKETNTIPIGDLDKVCFILINDYNKEFRGLGVGPLNDGYLIGLTHHRQGFKVFYLNNPRSEEFSSFLGFFIKNTNEALTVFYSGRGDDSLIEFINYSMTKRAINEIISENRNDKAHIVFITDCLNGGSVFDVQNCSNCISFWVQKFPSDELKEIKRSHGVFTYYFCKITSECPNISVNRLVDRLNPSIKRFNETLKFDISNKELINSPIFFN